MELNPVQSKFGGTTAVAQKKKKKKYGLLKRVKTLN